MTKGGIGMYWWVVVIIVAVMSLVPVLLLLTKRKTAPVDRAENTSNDSVPDQSDPEQADTELEQQPEFDPSPEFDTAGPPQTQPASEIGPHGGEFGTFEPENAGDEETLGDPPLVTQPVTQSATLPEAFPDPDPTSDLFMPDGDQIADTGAPASPPSPERP